MKKIVCLGGGVGTSNLIKGLKKYQHFLTVITSMADDGGSSGRLRKAYDIMPPGDIVTSIAAMIPEEQKELASLLLYRFPGENKEDKAIDGHKLGNLIMLAEIQRTGDFYKAIAVTRQMFGVTTASFYPATDERVELSAETTDGRIVHSETTLDLALYSEPHGLKRVFITPANPKVNEKVVKSIMEADMVISGPGDLYTNQLPVLIVPEIKKAVIETSAKKIFVLNVANKPFETKGFSLKDFTHAISEHLGIFPFTTVIVNKNFTVPIPDEYQYTYVQIDEDLKKQKPFQIFEEDLINDAFPLYHDATKLAKCVVRQL